MLCEKEGCLLGVMGLGGFFLDGRVSVFGFVVDGLMDV